MSPKDFLFLHCSKRDIFDLRMYTRRKMSIENMQSVGKTSMDHLISMNHDMTANVETLSTDQRRPKDDMNSIAHQMMTEHRMNSTDQRMSRNRFVSFDQMTTKSTMSMDPLMSTNLGMTSSSAFMPALVPIQSEIALKEHRVKLFGLDQVLLDLKLKIKACFEFLRMSCPVIMQGLPCVLDCFSRRVVYKNLNGTCITSQIHIYAQ